MGCPPGGLDLSSGLFAVIADPSLGVIYGQWTYGGGETTKHTTSMASMTHHATSTSTHTHRSTHSMNLKATHNASHSETQTSSNTAVPTTISVAGSLSHEPTASFLEDMNTLMAQYGSLLEAATEESNEYGHGSDV